MKLWTNNDMDDDDDQIHLDLSRLENEIYKHIPYL